MSTQAGADFPADRGADRGSLHGGVIVTLSAVLTVSIGFSAVYILNTGMLPSILVPTAAAGIGLAAGVISRWSLWNRSPAVRWLVAVVGVCFGLLFIGWVSQGKLGLSMGYPPSRGPDWYGLGQVMLGSAAAWLAVVAWNRRRAAAQAWDDAGTLDRAPVVVIPPADQEGVDTAPPRARPWSGTPEVSRPRIQTALPVRTAGRRRTAVHRRAARSIKLASTVEHRCPYCLDEVDPADPGGTRTCEICHTMHHLDCWNVTGACQVPHHH